MNRWYVAQTQVNAERKALFHLQRQGFTCYLPTYLRRRSHARKVEIVSAPLFPRYLFVRRDLSYESWRAIHSTVGISRLVCQNDRPVPLPDKVIDQIRAAEDKKGNVGIGSLRTFDVGEKIRITMGAFADQIGKFESLCADGRVNVLLEMLGRHVAVRVPASAVSTGV